MSLQKTVLMTAKYLSKIAVMLKLNTVNTSSDGIVHDILSNSAWILKLLPKTCSADCVEHDIFLTEMLQLCTVSMST